MPILRNRAVLLVLAVGATGCLASLAACTGVEAAATTPGATADAAPSTADAADSSPVDAGTPPQDGGDGGREASAPRFCETQAPLTGVADFFCADFDGTALDEGFTTTAVPDGGALSRLTDLFFSPPASVTSSNGATLEWARSAPATFSEIDVQFRVNIGTLDGVPPPTGGSVEILRVASSDSAVSIGYTRESFVSGTPYTGYFMRASSCSGACVAMEKAFLVPLLPINEWASVRLVWTSANLVKVAVNNVIVLDTTAYSSTSTHVSAMLGLVPLPDPPMMPRHAFDNFVVSVKRN